MAEVKWIKIVTEFFDDEKIKLIEAIPEADMILIIWIKLLTLAGKKNVNGYIFLTENIPYTDEMLATIFKRPLNTIRLALETFKKFKMISCDENEIMYITNWGKYQNIEGLEKIRELGRARQAKYMKHKQQKALITNDVSSRHTDDTRVDKIRLDKTREEKKDIKESEASFSLNTKTEKIETKDNDPLEFSFDDKCWWGLYDWRIKMYQGTFPMLTVNYLFNDKWKTKFLADPDKYKKMIKEKYEGDISKLVWAWLQQAKKFYIKDHPGYEEGG